MFQYIFPIHGPLREILYILEWLVVFFAVQWALIFYGRVKTQKESLKTLQEKAYVWIFIGYSLMWCFIIISDYHTTDPVIRNITLNTGFLIQVICVCLFVIIMERYKTYIKKYLFSSIFIIIAILYLFILLFFIEFGAVMSSIFWPFFFLFFIIYLRELVKNSFIKRDIRNFRLLFIRFFIGIILVGIGYQFSTRAIISAFGLEYRLIGDIFQILGLSLLSLFFFYIPSFSEYDWQESIEVLYIIHSSGGMLYKKQFKDQASLLDDNLITGALASIRLLIEEVSNEKGNLFLEKEGKIFLIKPGDNLIGVILSETKLDSLEILLNKLVQKAEIILHNVLKSWDGDLELAKTLEYITKEIFT